MRRELPKRRVAPHKKNISSDQIISSPSLIKELIKDYDEELDKKKIKLTIQNQEK